jgi:hypothetical protein
LDFSRIIPALNDSLAKKFQVTTGIESVTEAGLYLDREAFKQKGISLTTVEDYLAGLSASIPGVARILTGESLASATLPLLFKNKLINGYNLRRSGDMIILPEPGWKTGSVKGADHGLIYPSDTHIPLLFMGWKITPGATRRLIGMTDIAPTLASLLQVQVPSGCIGQPIIEITANPGFPRSFRPRHSPGPGHPFF